MTAKKPASKKHKSASLSTASVQTMKAPASITAGELKRYFESLVGPLEAVFYLSKLIAKGTSSKNPWNPEDVGAFLFMESSERLVGLADGIESRFKDKHEKKSHELPEETSVSITDKDVEQYERAFLPVCSFTNLIEHQDMEHEVAMYQVWIGDLIKSIASEGLALMRSRLAAAEGGAR
jgi:hypothetical protein